MPETNRVSVTCAWLPHLGHLNRSPIPLVLLVPDLMKPIHRLLLGYLPHRFRERIREGMNDGLTVRCKDLGLGFFLFGLADDGHCDVGENVRAMEFELGKPV